MEGKVFLTKEKNRRVLVDAEPYVMRRVRSMFENAKSSKTPGDYTHSTVSFALSSQSAKDITWLCQRYKLEISPQDYAIIQTESDEYDRLVDSVSNIAALSLDLSPDALELTHPLRDYQLDFAKLFSHVGRMLLADVMGLGKTISAISTLREPDHRPALVVVPSHLCTQWERELQRFLPGVTTHVIRGFKNYSLPKVDVVITSYNRLQFWEDILLDKDFQLSTLILDECHDLRRTGTNKRSTVKSLSKKATYCLGLSGTPIYNYGLEIWSVMDCIKDRCLGDNESFCGEWCDSIGKVREPTSLNKYLKSTGLVMRRNPQEVGLGFGSVSKNVITLDADLDKLKEVQDVARVLALSVLSGVVGQDSMAAREFDWKLRHATGVAKAKPAAEFVKMILEQGEKVVLVGWHRDVYDVWRKELANYHPVFYTGTEPVTEKDRSISSFVDGKSRVFVISLRSGAGLDGLQKVASHVVFGELDWSPHVMDQVVARLDRDGQTRHVQSYYLTVADGADPFMIGVLSSKRNQHVGLIEGKDEHHVVEDSGHYDRVKEMAKSYLTSIGEEIPQIAIETGLLGDVSAVLRRIKLHNTDENAMQLALFDVLKQEMPDCVVHREYKISARSRLDFLVTRGDEKVVIECKNHQNKKQDAYRQVRRYAEEIDISGLVIYAPWHGIQSFFVDSTPVVVVDSGLSSI